VIYEPWPRGRQRDGGIDEIKLPSRQGQLWLCGKHLVGPDPEAALHRVQATMLVCLTERHEISERYQSYVEWLNQHRESRAIWFPIPDLHAPPLGGAISLVSRLDEAVSGGARVIMHCAAGIGRSGTMAAALLMWGGMAASEAMDEVAAARPMAGPEVGPQRELLMSLELLLREHRKGPTGDRPYDAGIRQNDESGVMRLEL
jgi:protein-tyrosine phosphatase